MTHLNSRSATALAVLLSSFLLYACEKAAELPPVPTPVTVYAAGEGGSGKIGNYSANVVPYQLVRVSSQVGGTILDITQRVGADGSSRPLQGGDDVETGAVLLKVDDASYREEVSTKQADLAAATARYADKKVEYERTKELFEAGVNSAAELDSATSAYETSRGSVARAEHSVASAKIDLSHTIIKAPSSGTILEREVEEGDLASPGAELFQLTNLSRVKVVFGVAAAEAHVIQNGQVLTMIFESLAGREVGGTVTQISPAADARSRLFDVELTVENPDGEIRVGMVAKLKIPKAAVEGADGTVVIVPLDAVVRPSGQAKGTAVYIVETSSDKDGDVARQRIVEVGSVYGSNVSIVKGVSETDRVIVRGATLVHDGDSVRVMP